MTSIKPSSTNQLNKREIAIKCPVTFFLSKIGGRWKPLIINQLLSGPKRYGELKKAIPSITEKMLIQSLKELEADKLVIRQAKPVVPPHVVYDLSASGQDLNEVFGSMKEWSLKYNI